MGQILKGAQPSELPVLQLTKLNQPADGEGAWNRGAQLDPIAR